MMVVLVFREQRKKLTAIEKKLDAASKEGFVSMSSLDVNNDGAHLKKRGLAVIGIITTFGRRKNRDAIRKAWMPTGKVLSPL